MFPSAAIVCGLAVGWGWWLQARRHVDGTICGHGRPSPVLRFFRATVAAMVAGDRCGPLRGPRTVPIMSNVAEPRVWLDKLVFAEGPRYRGGYLYLSDQHARHVLRVDASGGCEEVVAVPAGPSGLGWLPDGTLLIVSMQDRKLLALRSGRLVEHADLSAVATGHCNEMVVDSKGRAYVGNFGFDTEGGARPAPAKLAMVTPDGSVHVVADDLRFPNGTVITPDGKTLIIAESYANRLTAFDIGSDGGLSNRRVWAQLDYPPDGICLDAEGHIWVSVPLGKGGFRRIAPTGEEVEHISTREFYGIACMLGGADGRTLFMVEAKTFDPAKTCVGNSRLRVTEVSVPAAGYPASG